MRSTSKSLSPANIQDSVPVNNKSTITILTSDFTDKKRERIFFLFICLYISF